MLDKKKLHFWQLVIVFSIITVMALARSFGYNNSQQPSMMGSSMGDMMGMHLENVTVSELILKQESIEATAGQTDASSHHNDVNGFLKTTHTLTTGTIIILLPFIVAGSIFLAIVWSK